VSWCRFDPTSLDPERWQQVKQLLIAAVAVPEPRRYAFLEAACGEDRALAAIVGSLLAGPETEGQGLSDTVRDLFSGAEPDDPLLGRCLGRYRLAEVLSSGGMGRVYLGLREHDFELRVAVKVIKKGMDTEAVARAFERERNIIAALDHPLITRLLDGGTTEDGRPYFVMELVRGRTILDACDQRRAPVRDRLHLFLELCDAVAHAHRNLVLHRDIKPANILVTEDGRPKLLDFGIATLLDPERGQAATTQSIVPRMTLGYAGPEQIRGERLTTATDVYSLGVVLYRLITGRHPYHLAGVADPARVICEDAPVRPSIAAVTVEPARDTHETEVDNAETNSRLRGCEPGALCRLLRGDLDAILMTALAKEPVDRYASVDEFAADIRRYLDGLPITARRPSARYLTAKLVRRHWPRLTIAAGVAITLLLFAFQARRARDRAELKRAQAEDLINFMLTDLSTGLRPIGRLELLEQVGEKAEAYFTALSAEERTPAVISRNIAAMHQIGEVRIEYGDVDHAERIFEESLVAADRLARLAADFDQGYLRQAFTHYWLGVVALERKRPERALEAFERYGAIAAARAAALPASKTWALERAYAMTNIGTVHLGQADFETAVGFFETSIRLQEQMVADHPDDLSACLEPATAYAWLGRLHKRRGQPVEALTLYDRAREITRALCALDPENSTYRAYLADSLAGLGRSLFFADRAVEAVAHQEEALSIYRTRFETDPANRPTRLNVIGAYLDLSETLRTLGAFDRTTGLLEGCEALFARYPAATRLGRDLETRLRLETAEISFLTGEMVWAESLVTTAIATLGVEKEPRADRRFLRNKAFAHHLMARIQAGNGRTNEARASWQLAESAITANPELVNDPMLARISEVIRALNPTGR